MGVESGVGSLWFSTVFPHGRKVVLRSHNTPFSPNSTGPMTLTANFFLYSVRQS
jgi:hypothetical protein